MEKMLHFDTDYMRGAHPRVLERLVSTNMEQTPGYGADKYTASAINLIKEACGCEQATVLLLVGGTQTNSIVIDGVLDKGEGVICADSGHINVHEAGAIEATGHKVLPLESVDGKLRAMDVKKYLEAFYADESNEHMVAPGMVYISHPTEYGTLYSKNELAELKKVCEENNLKLFIDGARLGYALAACPELSLKVIATLCDVFYIGGTKVGAMFGEAVVIPNGNLISRATALIKRHGALLAKGRLLGVQFETLFTDNLYQEISRNAIETAIRLKEGFVNKGYRLYIDSPTNQQFFILPNDVIDRLREKVTFEVWGSRGDKESAVRFVTDWGTPMNDVELLISLL